MLLFTSAMMLGKDLETEYALQYEGLIVGFYIV